MTCFLDPIPFFFKHYFLWVKHIVVGRFYSGPSDPLPGVICNVLPHHMVLVDLAEFRLLTEKSAQFESCELFYLGQNEDNRPGDSISDSSE